MMVAGKRRARVFGPVLVAVIMVLSSLGSIAAFSLTAAHPVAASESPTSLGTLDAALTTPTIEPQPPVTPAASIAASPGMSTVGNTADWVGDDPTGALGSDSLTFALSDFGSETSWCPPASPNWPCGSGGNTETNAYDLQINSNHFTCDTPFTGGVSATCWEQFVYVNCPNLSCPININYGYQENIYTEYWLLGFLNSNSKCPSMNIPDGGTSWMTSGKDCYADTTHVTATGEPPSNLGNLALTASVTGTTDTVTLTDSCTGNGCPDSSCPCVWAEAETDSILGLGSSGSWTQSEANIFGDNDGNRANFSAGTSISVTSSFTPAAGSPSFTPSCTWGSGTTGETNNLSAGPCTTSNDELSFTEVNGPAPTLTTTQINDEYRGSLWSGTEVTGASAFATADVEIGPESSFAPADTVAYDFWTNSACSGSPFTTQSVTLSGGTFPGSTPTGPLDPGGYSYTASYTSADSSNAGSVSVCVPFAVLPLQLILPPGLSGSTTIDSSGNTVVTLTAASGLMVGQVTFPPGTTYPEGEVTISYSTSTSGGITNNIIQVSGATVPDPPGKSILILASGNNEVCIVEAPPGVGLTSSPSCISTNPGQYQVLLLCNGQPYYDGALTYTCTRMQVGLNAYLLVTGLADSFVETLTKGTPTITSTVTPESVVLGGSATDLATLMGGYAPSGTVTFNVFRTSNCAVEMFNNTEPVGGNQGNNSTEPVSVTSAPFTPSELGLYEWIANFSGNVNNYAVSTGCGSEPFGVFDFTVSLSPAPKSLSQGTSTSMTVSVGLVAGSATIALPTVSLSLSGLPVGVVAVGFPSSLPIGSSQTFTVETSGVGNYVHCAQVSHHGGQNLAGADLAHCNLAGYNLKLDNLQGANLKYANLANANLAGANLLGANLAGADTTGASFPGANLEGADLSAAGPIGAFTLTATGTVDGASRTGNSLLAVVGDRLSGDMFALADLEAANLAGDVGVGSSFEGANLLGADLRGGGFAGANFALANLLGADLANGKYSGADFLLAKLVAADLADDVAVGAHFTGADLRGADLQSGDFAHADFAGANLRAVDLVNSVVSGADFAFANLQRADLAHDVGVGANFEGANMKGSSLHGGDFLDATFVAADLRNANLSDGDFNGANFTAANTHGANIMGATFVGAIDPP
jgi:uncharacterized protein YjbI with pentapeptide repeats